MRNMMTTCANSFLRYFYMDLTALLDIFVSSPILSEETIRDFLSNKGSRRTYYSFILKQFQYHYNSYPQIQQIIKNGIKNIH